MEFNQKGFTLIEIMIAILILAFMGAMTGVSIQRSIKIKAKVEKEIDDDSQLREVVSVLTKDINLAFHWSDPLEIVTTQIGSEATTAGKPNPFVQVDAKGQPLPTPTPNPIPLDKLTAFVGDKDSLYLTTLGNERTIRDSQSSDQIKVGYYLKNMRSFKDKKLSQTLMRRVSNYLDGDVTKGGKESVLIENVKTFKLRYLPEDAKEITDQSWIDAWKSDEGSDDKIKGKFPVAVELEMVLERDGRTSKIKTIIALHMPNNAPFKYESATPTPTPGATPVKKP